MIDLSGEWRFRAGDISATIDVPGFWEAQGHLTLDGLATYERDVHVEAAGPATLEFGAVADLCDVFWNGVHVGSHEVGFTPFSLAVDARAGVNHLRVAVTDPGRESPDFMRTPQGKQGWGNAAFPSPPSVYITYGGIWQPCRLVSHGPAYIEDVWCDMDPDAPKIGVAVRGEADEVEVRAFGRIERGPAGVFDFPGAELWSPRSPVLHTIEVAALCGGEVSHRRDLRTGLRSVERSGDDILINGSPYRMRSALHQGFWPRGLYAADGDLIDRDIDLALQCGLNTLRTHLKAFEPRWLDAADRKGLLLHCDLPIGEPLRDDALLSDATFRRRCLMAATEQVGRDRSRPAIVVWTLLNEVGLFNNDMLRTDPYREVVTKLTDAVRTLDPKRPIVENDHVFDPALLVSSDLRTAHWYGRTTEGFMREVDERMVAQAKDRGPFYVSEFGEWGLPSPEDESSFWDQDVELEELVVASGWRHKYEDFVAQTQHAQGWSDRIQAERFRTAAHIHGFCLTEWTDVPHELNGLVSLRRRPKVAVDAFRPALADVAPIAVLDSYAFVEAESVSFRVCVSNWSEHDLDRGRLHAAIGPEHASVEVPAVRAGSVSPMFTCRLRARGDELVLRYGDASTAYPLHVRAARPRPEVEIGLREVPSSRPSFAIEPRSLPDDWPELEQVPTSWGPTPVAFTTTGLGFGDDRVLSHEAFACYPKSFVPDIRGPIGLFVAPPVGKWGALVCEKDGLVVCTLSLADALERDDPFAVALVAEIAEALLH